MALSQEIKERIFAAADELFAASPTGELPSVEAVRQSSRAGMNNVVEAMKEWRQNQRKQVQTVREPLPAELLGVVQNMGHSLWETAQQLANESLEAAKSAFEAEKGDLIQLSTEQSEAYEKQAGELDKVQARVIELERNAEAAALTSQATAQQLEETRSALLAAEQRAAIAEQKAEEIERRAAELAESLQHERERADHLQAEAEQIARELDGCRAALAQANAERAAADQQAAVLTERLDAANARATSAEERAAQADARTEQLRATLTAQIERADATSAQLRAELATVTSRAEAQSETHAEQRKQAAQDAHRTAERLTKAQIERDDATKATAEARERAAGLAGQLEAVQQQNASLMAAIKAQPAPVPKKAAPVKPAKQKS